MLGETELAGQQLFLFSHSCNLLHHLWVLVQNLLQHLVAYFDNASPSLSIGLLSSLTTMQISAIITESFINFWRTIIFLQAVVKLSDFLYFFRMILYRLVTSSSVITGGREKTRLTQLLSLFRNSHHPVLQNNP